MTLSSPLRILSRFGAETARHQMLLPNTIVIGAQKAGTTWIHRRLAEHPDAFMTEQKEVNFFLGGSNAETLVDYSARFAGSENAIVRGESTPAYFWTPQPNNAKRQSSYGRAADWVRKVCGPDVRLILSLRDPVARAVSAHYHHFRAGRFPAAFRAPALQKRDRFAAAHPTRDLEKTLAVLEAFHVHQNSGGMWKASSR